MAGKGTRVSRGLAESGLASVWTSCLLCLVAQSRLTLCHAMDCGPPGSSVHGDSSGQNTGVGTLSLLQGIFPTQRWNPGLPHCKQILYQLSHTRTLIRFSEHTSLLPQSPLGSLSSSIYSLCIRLVLLREADERKM